jgi:high-affinity Fe2+/Pb2+ permease
VHKRTRIRYGLAVAAIIIGIAIVRVSINNVWIIRENITSCIPEELSEMFDREQAIICSNIQSQKSVLLAGVLLGAGIAIGGFIIVLVGLVEALMRNKADKKNLRI